MRQIIFILFSLCLSTSSSAQSNTLIQKKEKFEWGAGTLSFKGAHYRGSDQSREWFIPLPYFTYTSENIEAEPSFIRGTFYKNEWMALKLSLLAGLNIESEDNKARQGMPSLDYTFEAGPMVIFNLWESEDQDFSLTFEAPLRMVHTTDLTYVKDIGFFSVPYLSFKGLPRSSLFDWGFELSVAYMWGSKKYHEFFYGVAPQFATSNRPTYQAEAGYSGTQFTLILNKRFRDFVIVPFVRFDTLNGVAFRGSPLFKRDSYTVGGLAFFWLFGSHL